ncbi:MAG: MFS transporter [Thermoleophilaceae bacterium]|nr:MFS transporter [Thermoleophilaceae bacterium]
MRRLLFLVSAVVLVDTMFYAAIVPLLPEYRGDLGLSKSAAGGLTASYAAGTLLGALPSGWLAGRVGGKATVLTGLGLLAVSSVAFGFAKDIVLLDAARFVQGIGGACSWAGGFAWLMAAAPADRRGELIGTALGAAIFGVLLGPVLGGAATQTSPEVVFSGVGALALALAIWALSTPGHEPQGQARWSRLLGAVRGGPLLLAVWLVALPALFSGTIGVLVPLRLDELGAEGVTVGAIFLAAAAVEAILSPLLGRLSDRRGRMLPLRVGLGAALVAAVVLPLPGAVWLLGATVLFAVASLGMFWAPAAALLSERSESAGLNQGFAFGLMNLAWAAGQVVGGAGGGGLADATADALPYGFLGLLCALTLGLAGRSRHVARESSPASA